MLWLLSTLAGVFDVQSEIKFTVHDRGYIPWLQRYRLVYRGLCTVTAPFKSPLTMVQGCSAHHLVE